MEALAFELPISVEDYLEGEEKSEVRHEFSNGFVHTKAGEFRPHNRGVLP